MMIIIWQERLIVSLVIVSLVIVNMQTSNVYRGRLQAVIFLFGIKLRRSSTDMQRYQRSYICIFVKQPACK
jgi:hypothetical protein